MRLWPCPFSHAMADSLHCLDGTGPASAARSNGPLRTTLAVDVRQIFGGRRKALGPKTLGGIRKCEEVLCPRHGAMVVFPQQPRQPRQVLPVVAIAPPPTSEPSLPARRGCRRHAPRRGST